MKLRCAVIEDFQSVSATVTDWSPVTDDVEIVMFTEHLASVDEAAAALAGYDIVVDPARAGPVPGRTARPAAPVAAARRLRHA
ncbi:hypothetical protein SCYAM73S_07697 [Streptomyces cyaneofuscatus]